MDAGGTRKSQQIVRFDRLGAGWDIRASSDENSSPPHALVRRPPPLCVEPLGGALRPIPSVSPDMSRSKSTRKPTPLQRVDANCDARVLCAEIRMLEQQLAAERRARIAANKLVGGFCDYYKERRR